jgi:hypothetical protein
MTATGVLRPRRPPTGGHRQVSGSGPHWDRIETAIEGGEESVRVERVKYRWSIED